MPNPHVISFWSVQGQLKEEQAKSRSLLSRLSAMETDCHAALNAAQYDDDDLT